MSRFVHYYITFKEENIDKLVKITDADNMKSSYNKVLIHNIIKQIIIKEISNEKLFNANDNDNIYHCMYYVLRDKAIQLAITVCETINFKIPLERATINTLTSISSMLEKKHKYNIIFDLRSEIITATMERLENYDQELMDKYVKKVYDKRPIIPGSVPEELSAYVKFAQPIEKMKDIIKNIKHSLLDDFDKKKLIDADSDHFYIIDVKVINDCEYHYNANHYNLKGNNNGFQKSETLIKFIQKALFSKKKYNFYYKIKDTLQKLYSDKTEFNTENIARKKRNPKLTNCGHCHAEIYNVSKCGDCSAIYYCNRECQLAHWPEHEKCCVPKN